MFIKMKQNITILVLAFFIGVVTNDPVLGKANARAPKEISNSCEPSFVIEEISRELGFVWNEGKVRVGDTNGDFLSAPYSQPLSGLTTSLQKIFKDKCSIHISDLGGYTVRFTPLNSSLKKVESNKLPNPNLVTTDQLISSEGSTLGILSPSKDERLIIIYAAKIASAIVKRQGQLKHNDFSELKQEFDCEQDIEYQFGKIRVSVINGRYSKSMKEVAEIVFKQLTHQNYRPMTGYENAVKQFDGWIKPEKHESYWSSPVGIAQVELKKVKNGKVFASISETREIRTEPIKSSNEFPINKLQK